MWDDEEGVGLGGSNSTSPTHYDRLQLVSTVVADPVRGVEGAGCPEGRLSRHLRE